MANIVQFVSVDYIKQNTAIEENVSSSLISSFIIKVQDTHLQQILGSYFYQHLMDAVVGGTLTTAEDNLIKNYIQRLISEWVFYEAFPFLNYKATNKAISKQNSDNSVPSELNEIKFMRSAIRDMAEFYNERLNVELINNGPKYPEYQNPETPENLPKNKKSYFNGVYLKGWGRSCDPSEQYKNNN
ncbi:MAG: hypothetical protein GY870_06615 [archaeon]|nr:hypothetical protein [archaeon]